MEERINGVLMGNYKPVFLMNPKYEHLFPINLENSINICLKCYPSRIAGVHEVGGCMKDL